MSSRRKQNSLPQGSCVASSRKHDELCEVDDRPATAYAVIDHQGIILETCEKATMLFGSTSGAWNGRSFKFAIAADDHEIYHLTRKRLLETRLRQVCDIRMYHDNALFFAQLKMELGKLNGSRAGVIIVEITDRRSG